MRRQKSLRVAFLVELVHWGMVLAFRLSPIALIAIALFSFGESGEAEPKVSDLQITIFGGAAILAWIGLAYLTAKLATRHR